MSGAGKSTVLDALEDMGWDTVDNLPVDLLQEFVHGGGQRAANAAIGMDVRSRGFDAQALGDIIHSIEGVQPAFHHSHYAASKAAVIMHTRAAAFELGRRGIRVNCVSPGLIDVENGLEHEWPSGVERWHAAAPLHRLGRPADVADAVLFLASPAARWITGANLVVDGGVLTHNTW